MIAPLLVLEITVLTMSPGSDVFARFGHTAIRVEDDAGMRVYNFGAFKGDDPDIASKFLRNTLPYYLSVNEAGAFTWKYRDRTVVGQVLALDDSEARQLSDHLARTALPENRGYKYDWFRNNCTTRARDFIDDAVGGTWRPQLAGRPARWHPTIRALLIDALWSLPSGATICSISLNARSDEPLDAWQELAMPADLMLALREARRPDGRPLVASEWIWEGPAPRPRTQPRWLQPLFEGLLLYLLFIGAFARGRLARLAGGLGVAAWGLVGSGVGLWMLGWSFLGYPDGHWSANLIAWSPLLLFLVVLGVRLARGRLAAGSARAGQRLILVIGAASLVELSLHVFGGVHQAHARHTAYALVAMALSWLTLGRPELL